MAARKKIKPEVLSLWLNIAGFVISFFFYLALLFKGAEQAETVRVPVQDSLLVIDYKVHSQLREIKLRQDSLFHLLRQQQNGLATQQTEVAKARRRIHFMLQSDWDSLPILERRKYTEQLVKKLKK